MGPVVRNLEHFNAIKPLKIDFFPDFRHFVIHCLKSRTHRKPDAYQLSEIRTSLDFRHSLYYMYFFRLLAARWSSCKMFSTKSGYIRTTSSMDPGPANKVLPGLRSRKMSTRIGPLKVQNSKNQLMKWYFFMLAPFVRLHLSPFIITKINICIKHF